MKKLISTRDPIFPMSLHPIQLYEYGLEIGIPKSELLSAANLQESQITELELKISWEQYRAIGTCIQKYKPNEWGFQLGKRLGVASHGLMSLAIMNCTNWSQIVRIISNYAVLISPIVYIEVKEGRDHFYMTAYPEMTFDPFYSQFVETTFTTIYQTILHIGGIDFKYRPNDVCLLLKGEPPSHAKAMHTYFHSNIRWGHYLYQMRFNKDIVDQKIYMANPLSANSARRTLQAQLAQLKATKGCLHELRDLFVSGVYNQEDCAKALLCSAPTLKRHLAMMSTSFSQELTRYRLEEACWALKHTDTTVARLSDKLGFQDIGSFRRLFKKEMELSPIEFRESEDTEFAMS